MKMIKIVNRDLPTNIAISLINLIIYPRKNCDKSKNDMSNNFGQLVLDRSFMMTFEYAWMALS